VIDRKQALMKSVIVLILSITTQAARGIIFTSAK
jgi:hypothetical protein